MSIVNICYKINYAYHVRYRPLLLQFRHAAGGVFTGYKYFVVRAEFSHWDYALCQDNGPATRTAQVRRGPLSLPDQTSPRSGRGRAGTIRNQRGGDQDRTERPRRPPPKIHTRRDDPECHTDIPDSRPWPGVCGVRRLLMNRRQPVPGSPRARTPAARESAKRALRSGCAPTARGDSGPRVGAAVCVEGPGPGGP